MMYLLTKVIQYFVRTADNDVERYLKMFTFVPIAEINSVMETHIKDPSKRVAQHRLAREFVELIHGGQEAEKTAKEHQTLFLSKYPAKEGHDPSGETTEASESAETKKPLKLSMFEMPSPHLTLPRSLVANQFFHKVLWSAGLASSKAEAFRLIVNNGVHVGSRADSNQPMGDAISYVPVKTWPPEITEKFIIDDSLMVLRIGKWKIKIIKIVPDEEYEKMGLTAPGWGERETGAERNDDKELFKNNQKIGGHKVKLPGFAQQLKPAIRSWRPGQERPVLREGEEGGEAESEKQ